MCVFQEMPHFFLKFKQLFVCKIWDRDNFSFFTDFINLFLEGGEGRKKQREGSSM